MSEKPQSKPPHEEETSSSSSEEEELPPLPASRPASVISVPASSSKSLLHRKVAEDKSKVHKTEKTHKKDTSLGERVKQVFETSKKPKTNSNVEMSEDRGIKPKNPDTYEGGARGLERFLSQCQVYFFLKKADFHNELERILFAGSHLRGPAADWFTPFIRDMARGDQARPETKQMMKDYSKFEQALEQLYGNRDKTRTAIRQITQLKQAGSASQYTATFRRLAAETGWDDSALLHMYYMGLKDGVKDELARMDRPRSLDQLIDRAIGIDERIYERRMERGGGYHQYKSRKPSYGDPMDLSATRGPLSKKDREHRMKNNLCLYCGKPGHRARECKASKSRKQLAATHEEDGGLPHYLRATRTEPPAHWTQEWEEQAEEPMFSPTIERAPTPWPTQVNSDDDEGDEQDAQEILRRAHGTMHWTACHDDACTTHFMGKIDAGWFPKGPKEVEEPEPANDNEPTAETDDRSEPPSNNSDFQWDPEKLYFHHGAQQLIIPGGRMVEVKCYGSRFILELRQVHPEEHEDLVNYMGMFWLDADKYKFVPVKDEAPPDGSTVQGSENRFPQMTWRSTDSQQPTEHTYTPQSPSTEEEL